MDATSIDARQGLTVTGKEVEELARNFLREHISRCGQYAIRKARRTVQFERARIRKQDEERLQYLEHLSGIVASAPNVGATAERVVACAVADLAFAGLNDIVGNFMARSSQRDYDQKNDIVTMNSVENVPKYDAWVPVRTNFWVGKDMELEPYMPYFGDDNDGRSKAFDLYKDMTQDAKQENPLSDGEVDSKGEFQEPKSDAAWAKYESLSQVRHRAGCREAILQVLELYDEDSENMLDGLASALNITNKRRLRAVINVAQTRRQQKIDDEECRKTRARQRNEVVMAMTNPKKDLNIRNEGSFTKAALKNFCFTCQLFHCLQHLERDVEPLIPISDPTVERRERQLRANKAKVCSSKCFMMDTWRRALKTPYESEAWTAEEIMALRESTAVFREDPCSLAIVVGTRSCREVHEKLAEAEEAARMRRSIAEARQKRKIDTHLISQRTTEFESTVNESDEEIALNVTANTSNSQKKKAHKRLEVIADDSKENEDFIPCYHAGECVEETCTCVKRGLWCESTCACNNARFCAGPTGRGITRYVDGEACHNLSPGCFCQKGHCNTDNCTCWANNRACNPDVCNECDCNILPSQLAPLSRRCRNVSVSIARHKRTYVGKSDVHGYGLFAGDYFQQGDLVGIYGGQLLDTRLADMVGRLYDAKDHTFFFDITESVVVDGGVLGMKAKFCNHSNSGGQDENVHSKMIRVRGEAHVALFTKRAVKPGEELKFDYKFTSVVPPWAKAVDGPKEEATLVTVEDSPRPNKTRSKRSGR